MRGATKRESERGRWLEAEPHYRVAIRLDSSRIQDVRELMTTLVKLDRADDAVEFAARWQKQHPDVRDEGGDQTGPHDPEEGGAGQERHEQLAQELAVVVELLGAHVHS